MFVCQITSQIVVHISYLHVFPYYVWSECKTGQSVRCQHPLFHTFHDFVSIVQEPNQEKGRKVTHFTSVNQCSNILLCKIEHNTQVVQT